MVVQLTYTPGIVFQLLGARTELRRLRDGPDWKNISEDDQALASATLDYVDLALTLAEKVTGVGYPP